MASEVFIDTSGYYALLVGGDDRHGQAAAFMKSAAEKKRRFVTTDYVVDETATLLLARRMERLVSPFLDTVIRSSACRMLWMDADRFERTRVLFVRHLGSKWSFTDCLSFVVMRELGLHDALTKDGHFRSAGFFPLLA